MDVDLIVKIIGYISGALGVASAILSALRAHGVIKRADKLVDGAERAANIAADINNAIVDTERVVKGEKQGETRKTLVLSELNDTYKLNASERATAAYTIDAQTENYNQFAKIKLCEDNGMKNLNLEQLQAIDYAATTRGLDLSELKDVISRVYESAKESPVIVLNVKAVDATTGAGLFQQGKAIKQIVNGVAAYFEVVA